MAISDAPTVRLPINRDVAKTAREQASLHLDEAASRINKALKRDHADPIKESDLIAWEQGTDRPTDVQAEALASVYLIPFVDLFQEKWQRRNILDFRLGVAGRTAALSYETKEKLSRFDRLYELARRASQSLDVSEESRLPHRSNSTLTSDEDFEGFATELRNHFRIDEEIQESWKTDAEAYQAWKGTLEASGICIFELPMFPDECRAAAKWEAGGPPAALVSTIDATAARLFSLLHEVSHLVFKKSERTVICEPPYSHRQQEERDANKLAGATLVPSWLIESALPAQIPSQDYSFWPDDLKKRIKGLTHVSNAVIGIRLQQLGIVTDSGYRRTWAPTRSTARGKNRAVRERFRRYLGRRAIALTKAAVDSERLTVSEIAMVLNIKMKDALALVS